MDSALTGQATRALADDAAVQQQQEHANGPEIYDEGTSVLLDEGGEGGGRNATAGVGGAFPLPPSAETKNSNNVSSSSSNIAGVTAPDAGGLEASIADGLTIPKEFRPSGTAAAQVRLGFVQPSSYLRRPRAVSRTMPSAWEETLVERDQKLALRSIRAFLRSRNGFDVLPLSYRLIVFDTSLLVKKSLNILVQNGIVSAPLWDSKTSTFAGMLTTSDYINLIQYYWQNPDAVSKIDQFRLDSLRDIEKAIGVAPIETVSAHPLRSLYEAGRTLIDARARRIPMIDIDDDTRRAMTVSVLTQYRLLKFVATNVTETQNLKVPLRYLPNVGTYTRISTADMDTPVIKVIHMMVSKQVSSVPILTSDGVVVNVFEAVDVLTLIKGGNYDCLTLPVGEALSQRAPDFPGIFTCTLDDRLDSIFDTIRKSRVHRFIIIDDANRLKGTLALSDILKYLLLEGEKDDNA